MLTREELARLVLETRKAQKACLAAREKGRQGSMKLERMRRLELELDQAVDEILTDDLLPLGD